jgi:hypothetical protein
MVVHSEFKLYLNLPLNLGMKLGKENRIKKQRTPPWLLGLKSLRVAHFPFSRAPASPHRRCARTHAFHPVSLVLHL